MWWVLWILAIALFVGWVMWKRRGHREEIGPDSPDRYLGGGSSHYTPGGS
jgi:hypothetical protein